MQKYLIQVKDYWEIKILAGLFASTYTDDVILLLCLFLLLEILDIFTRWIALSCECYHSLYPQTKAGIWVYIKFIPQTRKWRYIKSNELRVGFCNKMITYLLLLLLAMLVDGALTIAYSSKMKILLGCTVTVLSTTEALSIFENLADSGVSVISQIKEKFLGKIQK